MVRPAHRDARSRALRREAASGGRELDRTFAALADPTRRAVVRLLRDGSRRAGELADALGATPAGLSRHLRILRESGLVAEDIDDGDARVRVYTLERARFEAVRAWIEDVETFWTEQLAAFKAHAERTQGRKR